MLERYIEVARQSLAESVAEATLTHGRQLTEEQAILCATRAAIQF